MRKELKQFYYTKANGERSFRKLIVLRPPQTLYLGLDVTELSAEDIEILLDQIEIADEHRNLLFEEAGVSNRWRSFKPEGIEWVEA